jgi:hypothetical protein
MSTRYRVITKVGEILDPDIGRFARLVTGCCVKIMKPKGESNEEDVDVSHGLVWRGVISLLSCVSAVVCGVDFGVRKSRCQMWPEGTAVKVLPGTPSEEVLPGTCCFEVR